MRLPRRLLARLAPTAVVVVLGGIGVAAALEGRADPVPDLRPGGTTPLFSLAGMQPGEPPVERCISITAAGASLPRPEVSAAISGALAQALEMEVSAGHGAAAGAAHSCAGFVEDRALWSGRLADFPDAAAPTVDDQPLAAGAIRAYRFRVALPVGATGVDGQVATQSIVWRATFDDPPPTTESGPDVLRTESTGTPTAPAPSPPAATSCTTECSLRARVVMVSARTGRLLLRVDRARSLRRVRVDLPRGLSAKGLRGRIVVVADQRRVTVGIGRKARRGRPVARATGRRRLELTRLPPGVTAITFELRVPRASRKALARLRCRRARLAIQAMGETGTASVAPPLGTRRKGCR